MVEGDVFVVAEDLTDKITYKTIQMNMLLKYAQYKKRQAIDKWKKMKGSGKLI